MLTRARGPALAPAAGVVAALFAVGVLAASAGATTGTYDTWTAAVIGPVLFAATIPALRRQALREGDRRFVIFLAVVLALKLAGSVLRHFITFEVYERADATGYHEFGVALSERFRAGDFTSGLPTHTGTNFVRLLTGIVYTVIGPSKLGGFIVFSWLGFLGLFWFYRAFVLVVPDGRKRLYAGALFLLPTLMYWPSSIGKDAWMTFTLGLATLGAAHILTGAARRGVPMLAAGLWLAALLRPHVAGMLMIGLAAAAVVRRSHPRWGIVAPVAKAGLVAVLGLASLLLVTRADGYLQDHGVPTQEGLAPSLGMITDRTSAGGSRFEPASVSSPIHLPAAAVTILFRPHPLEAHNTQSFLTAIEGMVLLLLTLARWRSIVAAVRGIRRRPFVALVLVYMLLFVVAFSGIANFGLLARQRVQLLPLYLVLLMLPSKGAVEQEARRAA